MGAAEPRLSLRAVCRGIVRVYAEHWRLLLAAGVLVFVPLGFVEAADAELQKFDVNTLDELTAIAVAGVAVGHVVSALLGDVFYSGVVASGAWETRGGKAHSLRDIARTIPWGRLVAVDLLFALIAVVGFMLLIVPGLVFLAWFSISGPIVKIERRAPRDALRRSRELVRGSFWRVFAIVIPVVFLTDAAVSVVASFGESIGGESLLGEWAGAALGEFVATPLYAAVVVVLAFELIALERARLSPSSADS
jgi:hypothetical protein